MTGRRTRVPYAGVCSWKVKISFLRALHTESEIFVSVFPFFRILHPFLLKWMLRMQKRWKLNLIQILQRKFQRQCVNVTVITRGRIYFSKCKNFGRTFLTHCAETFTHQNWDLNYSWIVWTSNEESCRVLSHLLHLVWLNRIRVGSPSWCGSFGPVRMQQSHSGAHQKQTKQAYRDLKEVVSVHFQSNPGAVRLWWERDPTSSRPNCKKNCAFLD